MSRETSNAWIGLVVAVAITAVLMTAVGWAISRAQEFYFAVATLALSEVGLTVFTQWRRSPVRAGTSPASRRSASSATRWSS